MEDSKDVKETSAPVEETPSSSKDLSKTLPEEAFNNFLQGKRHIVVQDYKFAVQSLSTACEMYTSHFGEMALECGEVYFLYGKALFRLSQQQALVLGGALNDEGTEDEEQEKSSEEDNKENESEKNDSDTEENGEENPEENGEEMAEGEEEEKEPSESTDSPQAAVADETSKEAPEKEVEPTVANDTDKSIVLDESKVEEEESPPKEEEDLEDLELAWNSLETAKSIFSRQGEKDVEAQLKVAEILLLLAEISMESDNNIAAIADLKECLVIQRRHLKPDDRRLAETFYQMGMAQVLDKQYDEALENFSTTMSILQLKIDNLRATPVADTVGNFESADREKEIEDLESVLADIREKMEDTKELIQDMEKKIKEAISEKFMEAEEVGFGPEEKTEPTNKPVTNINHLLKRKKPDQDEEDSKSKRLKLTPGVQTNGVS